MQVETSVRKIIVFIVLAFLGAVLNAYAQEPAEEAFKKGTDFVNKGLYLQAIAEFNNSIQAKPDFAEAYAIRGTTYYAIAAENRAAPNFLDNLNQSLSDLNKALELKPNSAYPYVIRAAVYAGSGNVNMAIADCTKAIELYPNLEPDAAQKLIAGRDFTKEEIEEARRKGLAEAYYNRAHFYYMKMQIDEALADINKALEYDPQNTKFNEYKDNLLKIKEQIGQKGQTEQTPQTEQAAQTAQTVQTEQAAQTPQTEQPAPK